MNNLRWFLHVLRLLWVKLSYAVGFSLFRIFNVTKVSCCRFCFKILRACRAPNAKDKFTAFDIFIVDIVRREGFYEEIRDSFMQGSAEFTTTITFATRNFLYSE